MKKLVLIFCLTAHAILLSACNSSETTPAPTEVESTAIDEILYDADARELTITFEAGSTYKYKNLPEEVYQRFLVAESKGGMFNDEIKGRYDFEIIEEE